MTFLNAHTALPRARALFALHCTAAAILAFFAVPIIFALIYETHILPRHQIVFLGQFAFLVSWIGFLLLLAAFGALTKFNRNGFFQTTLAGASLGPLAMMIFSGLEASLTAALRDVLEPEFLIVTTALGGIHAAVFWLILRAQCALHLRLFQRLSSQP